MIKRGHQARLAESRFANHQRAAGAAGDDALPMTQQRGKFGSDLISERSLDEGMLPLGLAHNIKLKRDIAVGEMLKWADVEYDPNDSAVKVRREMEAAFGRRNV